MSLRDLDYQSRTLARLDEYLIELSQQKKKTDKISEANARETDPDLIRDVPDFASKTWEVMRTTGRLPESRAAVPYSSRADGVGRTVPNVVFKVPTGGGKTYLAVSALSRIFGRYLGGSTGFVLWIVPNEAIYSQTKKQLADRQHPYRQMLDVQSGNRVILMEKRDRLDARDVQGNLCVMLLMLQSSNRDNKDTLKMFQDRGDVQGFFPPEGDMELHKVAMELTPNLDAYGKAGEVGAFWPIVKDSLGNALRLIRPVVVMDEGHRAVSELAFSTLYGFNPCFVLELSATPKDVAATGGKSPRPARYANVLIEVKGIDLDREGMIKMPLNLDSRQGSDWRNTLAVALDRLNTLDSEARWLHGERGRYIRPIMLVQAERTGSDQRDGSHIHALDVKEWLVNSGLDEAEIAIKTADTNDLAALENQDLLSPINRVRVIITKQALQEGWDCPFAYVLCVLAASGNLSALTQLVGRILRQPHAEKTGVASLDECYVITHHGGTADVVAAIKAGLEEDGMGDLVKEIRTSDNGNISRKVKRRAEFDGTEIFLPLVLRMDGESIRPLDYEQDILFDVDWTGLDVSGLVAKIPDNIQSAEHQMRRIHLADIGNERIVSETVGTTNEMLRFDPAYAVRMISDIVPNAWIAREIVGKVKSGLQGRGFDDAKFSELAGLLVEELRKWLDGERDRMARSHFSDEVAVGRIQFRLRADGKNWRMPFEIETFEPETADQLVGKNGVALERSLFSPIYKGDFSNPDERDIAVYLDGEAALVWWHRNAARNHFSIQGWRREKVYPDFIFAMQRGEIANQLVVLEMKGKHLSGNPDTEYKKALLQLMSVAFNIEQTTHVGELELVVPDGTTVECALVLMTEWKTRLPNEFLKVSIANHY
ncbi:MAG: DEAD/DEAH box helicase family protein [Pseudomonadota bacterium]|nr:DEAD/DEAH box helicase family protein [Pseudomonadota bacterium]